LVQGWGHGYDDCPELPLIIEDARISQEKPMEDAEVCDITKPVDMSSEGTVLDDVWHPIDDIEEISTWKRSRSPSIDIPQPTIPKKPRSGNRIAMRKISISSVKELEGSQQY
jgi:hypothetical protein